MNKSHVASHHLGREMTDDRGAAAQPSKFMNMYNSHTHSQAQFAMALARTNHSLDKVRHSLQEPGFRQQSDLKNIINIT